MGIVPTIKMERRPGRKVLAKAARALFKHLGLRKRVSVTAPRYSMAQSVDVVVKGTSHDARAIEGILAKAFPNQHDRSELQSDHFDYCWSITNEWWTEDVEPINLVGR